MRLGIRIKRSDFLDCCILLLMFLQLTFLGFWGWHNTLNKIIALLMLLQIFKCKGYRCLKKISAPLLIIIVFYTLGILSSGNYNFSNIKSNFMMLLYPAIYAIYIFMLAEKKQYIIDNIAKNGFIVFNAVMLINFVVLFIQISYPNSIVGVTTGKVISFYEDTVSGFFGYAATHVLALYSVFIIAYNLLYCTHMVDVRKKLVLKLYLIFVVFFNGFISMNNDNKAFFLLLPIVVAICYLISGKGSLEVKKNLKMLGSILVVVIAIYLGYLWIPSVTEFLDERVFSSLDMILSSRTLGASARGSRERFAIIPYAFSQKDTWSFGAGFGTTGLYESGFNGFIHFGQADFGSILLVGGVWFLVALIIMYYKVFKQIVFAHKNDRHNKVVKILLWLLLIVVSVYTQCFTRSNYMCAFMLLMLSFRLVYMDEKN